MAEQLQSEHAYARARRFAEKRRLPPHRLVIEPLVRAATSGVVSALLLALAEDIEDDSCSVRNSAAEALCALQAADVEGIEDTLLERLQNEEDEVTRCSIGAAS